MADTTAYITAGLPTHKDAGQTVNAGETTVFITAGLPKVTEVAAGGLTIPIAMRHYLQMAGVG